MTQRHWQAILPRPMDFWRCAIVRQTNDAIIRNGMDPAAIAWLPDTPPEAFRADPFGLWHGGKLHVFAEFFDYRTRIGHIDVLSYDGALQLQDCRVALQEPWHLSYPVVFEADDDIWMLPEAYRSGTLTLYRARSFPNIWEPACKIPLDGPAIDATPLFFDGLWWLFYSPSHLKQARRCHLHVAWATALTGPWRTHPMNPVRVDCGSARPGGTARIECDTIILPVQDCRQTYGGAVRQLRIRHLTETEFVASDQPGISPPAWMAPFADGLHTLSEAGPISLIDVKRTDNSLRVNAVRLRGLAHRGLRDLGVLRR